MAEVGRLRQAMANAQERLGEAERQAQETATRLAEAEERGREAARLEGRAVWASLDRGSGRVVVSRCGRPWPRE